MNKRLIAITIAIVMMLTSFPAATVNAQEPLDAAAEGSLSSSDKPMSDGNLLRMWYTKPASNPGTSTSWQAETLPLGNGTIGGLVFGGVSKDRVHFNEKSLWTGGPGSVQATINYPASDALPAGTTLPYNGGNRVTAVTPAALQAYRTLLDDKSINIWGENFTNPASSGIMETVFGSSSGNPSTQMSRWQDFGDINLTFPDVVDASAQNYVRDLDMRTGLSTVNYDYNDVHYEREYFVSYPDNVMVMHLTASQAASLTFDVSTALASADLNTPANTNRSLSIEDGDTIVLDGSFKMPTIGSTGTYALNGLKFAYRLKVLNDGGTLTPNASTNTISVTGADSVTLVFSCGTDYKNEYPNYRSGVDPHETVKATVDAAVARGYESLKQRHVTDHSNLFGRVEIDLADGFVPTISTDELVASYGRSIIPEQPYVNVASGSSITASGRQSTTYTETKAVDNNNNTIWISENSKTPSAIITMPNGIPVTFDMLQLVCVTPGYMLEYKSGSDWLPIVVKDTQYKLDQDFRDDIVKIDPVTTTDIRIRWDSDKVELGNNIYYNKTLGELRAFDTTKPAVITNHIATDQEQRALESMAYQYGRYLTIAGSREGSLPTNLGGAWLIGSASGLWGSDYHFNINVQMNYWPTLSGNLAECETVFNDYVDSLREPGRVTAAQSAGVVSGPGEANGFLVNTQNNIYGYTAPSGSQEYGYNIAGSTWALQNVYDYYRYTGDVDYLRNEIYPMMKEMANFWENFLWYSPYQKRLVVSPSCSPEEGPVVNGSTYDQSLVWEHFKNIIEAAQILGVDSDKIAHWRSIQDELQPIQIGNDGQIKEWFEETSLGMASAGSLPESKIPNYRAGIAPVDSIVPHRHLSQLIGLYPGTLISKDSSQEVIDATMVSLEERGFGATSWSKSHKINSWARMGLGEESYQMLRSMLGGGNAGLQGNLLASHGNNSGGTINYTASPIFQIDGNFGMAAGICEMLLQSQLGYTQFLPALPSEWDTGSISGIVARGNFVIDMNWSDGIADQFKVTSRNGGTFTGEYLGITAATVKESDGTPVAVTTTGSDKISFNTQKGKTYVININKLSIVIGEAKTISNTMTDANLATAKARLDAAVAHAEQLMAGGAADYSSEVSVLLDVMEYANTAIAFDGAINQSKEQLEDLTVGTQLWEFSQAEHDAFAQLINNSISVIMDNASTPEAMKSKQADLQTELAIIAARITLIRVDITQQGTSVTMDSYYDVPEIRYTLDGSEPTAYSNIYKAPLTITNAANIKAALFYNGEKLESSSAFRIPAAVNIAPTATGASASSSESSTYDGPKAIDASATSAWRAAASATTATLELTFPKAVTVDQMIFRQQYNASSYYITQFNIEYWQDEEWKVAYSYSGEKITAATFTADLTSTVTSDKIRMNILDCKAPRLYEFELYNTAPISMSSDKSTLQNELSKASVAINHGVVENPATSTSQTGIQKAYNWSYNYAKAVNERDLADQATVDDAYDNLHAMLASLKLVTGDPAALAALHDAAAALVLTDYDDPDKVAAFSATLARAAALIADSTTLQAEFDDMCTKLTAAQNAMQATVKDWTSLMAMIAIADAIQDQIDKGTVFETGIEEFTAGRAAAHAIAAKPETRQQQINEAADALKTAITVLVPAVPGVGKEALMTTVKVGSLAISRGVINLLTPTEKASFNQAMIGAKMALNNPAADQTAVDNANNALNATLTLLKLNKATDMQKLQSLFDDCSKLVLTDYDNAAAVKAFETTLNTTRLLLSDTDALQREIDNQIAPLQKAAELMKQSLKDRNQLKSMIDAASLKLIDAKSGKYVEADVRILEHAIASTQIILNDPKSSQAQMDEAVRSLQNAMAGLRLAADKTKLAALIETAGKINLEAYTTKTANALVTAMTKAIQVRDNPNLSVDEQAQVNQATDDLQKAINGLVRKSSGGTSTNSSNNTTTNTNDNTEKEKVLKDTKTGISVSVGDDIKEGVKLSVVPISEDSEEYKALLAGIKDEQTMILAFDISLDADYKGPITLHFPVGDQYNGQTLTLLHYVDGAVESYKGLVENGILTVKVSHLSPFIVVVNNSEANPEASPAETEATNSETAISGLPQECKLNEGGQVTWMPSPAGGTWKFDESYLSKTEDGESVTFTAIKTGNTSISYTVDDITATVSVTIQQVVGQSGGSIILWIVIVLAVVLAGGVAAVVIIKKKKSSGSYNV